MRTRIIFLSFVLITFLFALSFFSNNLAIGDMRVDNFLNLTTESSFPADTIYCQDFEYGWLGWYADNGVWEVGQDSLVPSHSGDSLAGTVLNGTYPNTSSHLVSPAINLPSISTDEALRLRFWHWFKFGDYDVGQVQIQVDSAGSWQPWKTIYGDLGGDSPYWTPIEVEISAYVNKRVRFGFYLKQGIGSYVDWGWYVDDICVLISPASIAAPCTLDFESGWGDWWASNGVWEVGQSSLVPSHSGDSLAGTVLNGMYPNTYSHLVSPAIDLSIIDSLNQGIYLSFWYWFKFGDYDVGQVRIQVDSAGNWQPWKTITGDFSGDSPVWTPYEVQISAYAGKRVRFGFYLKQGIGSYVDWGWYVDDVSVDARWDSVTVLNPNGRDCLGIEPCQYTIRWNWWDQSGTFQYVKIEFSSDSGNTWKTLDDSASNTGFWKGVLDSLPSNNCLIRISDIADGFPSDVSDSVFTVKFIRGDANLDCQVSVSDVVYLISYLFKGGDSPKCPPEPYTSCGDANSDGNISVSDCVFLICYLFKQGPAPACTTE